MATLTPLQAIERIRQSDVLISKKISNLTKGARFYKVLGYFTRANIAIFTGVNIALEVYFISNDNLSFGMSLSLRILLLIFSLVLAFFTATETVVTPNSYSDKCSSAAKQYKELLREIYTLSDSLKNLDPHEQSSELYHQLLYYSARVQLIVDKEPLLVWIGHKKEFTGIVEKEDQEIEQAINESNLSDDDKTYLIGRLAVL